VAVAATEGFAESMRAMETLDALAAPELLDIVRFRGVRAGAESVVTEVVKENKHARVEWRRVVAARMGWRQE
jgi:hypothetical protein